MFTEEPIQEALTELLRFRSALIEKLGHSDAAITQLQKLLGVKPQKLLLQCPHCKALGVLRVVLEPVPEGYTAPNGTQDVVKNGASSAEEIVVSKTTKIEPDFAPGAFFGMTQRKAAAEVLRRFNRPMAMVEIVDTLKKERFAFNTRSPYASLFKTMTRGEEFIKHGKEWQLRDWKRDGSAATTMPIQGDIQFDASYIAARPEAEPEGTGQD